MSNIRRSMMAASRGGGATPIIPTEYDELEYYYNRTTTMYFVTDFVPTTGCRVEVCFKGTSTTSTKAGGLFGSRSGYNNNSFYARSSAPNGSATTITLYMGFKTERSQAVNVNASDKNIYGVDAGRFYVNNDTIGTYTDAFTPTYPIYILRWNNAGSVIQNASVGNLYYCRCWDDLGELVRDYRPVNRKADNVQGLFEVITQTFITAS